MKKTVEKHYHTWYDLKIIEYSEKGKIEIMIEKDAYKAEKEARERRLMAYSE